MMWQRIAITAAALLLVACSERPQLHRHSVLVFGTLVEITIPNIEQSKAEKLFLKLDDSLQRWHNRWTPWDPQSDLSKVNRAIAAEETFELPSSIQPLLENSMHYFEVSEGMFNPAIGGLIKLWQFHRHQDPELMPPGPSAIHSYSLTAPLITQLKRNVDGSWFSLNRHVDLNFGAYAKGIAIDWLIDDIQREGIRDAVVNAGGDLVAIGSNISAEPTRAWSIGIQHPRGGGVIASIRTDGREAVFTSGDYERFYIRDGVRYHHILDPRTGYPTEGTTSVTVIDSDAGRADAAATALMVAGVKDWQRIARQMGLRYVMLIDTDGTVHMNPEMAERVRFEVEPQPRIVIGDIL